MSQGSSVKSPRTLISPRARRILRERGIDPTTVVGSGPGGRIVELDVPTTVSKSTQHVSSMRRAIARITTASAAIPQFSLYAEIDAFPLMSLREQLVDMIRTKSGHKLSITDFLLLAQASALADLPRTNAIWQNDAIQAFSSVNVGLVVAVDGGLILTTIADAGRLSLLDLVRRRADIVSAARSGRQLADTQAQPASSLSNLGHSRVDQFIALLMPPQSTMLAVGRIAQRPFVVDSLVIARPTLRLTLTADHRVLDGVQAAEFLTRIVEYLEQPDQLLNHPSRVAATPRSASAN